MERFDLIIVGAGPAGLSAAIEARKHGMKTAIFDENARPGGQLFKQIHKFFGSKEHHAKVRGVQIGKQLLQQAIDSGAEVYLDAVVTGIFRDRSISVMHKGTLTHYHSDNILVATGASERMIPFENWNIPGVIGAGAAQTMMNLHGVRPGKRVLMVGSGNMGLVVSYQLLQAGCEVVAIIDAAPRIGGYGVHAAKLTRCGVLFYLSHTIVRAEGEQEVTGVVIAKVDANWQVIPGTETHFDVDTICMAVGLSPMSQLVRMAGAQMQEAGGLMPLKDAYGATTVPGLYVAGDVGGIEEASSAMIGGHITALAAANRSGFIEDDAFEAAVAVYRQSLAQLRQGMFAVTNRGKAMTKTEEGIALSESLLRRGYLNEDELERYPGVTHRAGVHPVIECTQNIPCNPCQDACRFGCIQVGKQITSLPVVDQGVACKDCGMCVAACSGQAIFLVDEAYDEESATVTIPYEFQPLPTVGQRGLGLDRTGAAICTAEIVQVRTLPAFDHTALVTMRVPRDMAMRARFFREEAQ